MQLYCSDNSRTYGTVGDATILRDKYGNPLFVGDVVLLTHKKNKAVSFKICCSRRHDITILHNGKLLRQYGKLLRQ